MKRFIIFLIIITFVAIPLYGCGDTKEIGGVEYGTYGLFDKGTMKNPDIEYKIIVGNIIWSVILFETIIAPIYFIGFSIYEPI